MKVPDNRMILIAACVLAAIIIVAALWIILGPGSNHTASGTSDPKLNATLSDVGMDRDTYKRGDNVTCWANVTNTGNVPIDEINFTVSVFMSLPILGYQQVKDASYSAKGLAIPPGGTRTIEFNETIPATYQGISTAGKYKFDVSASLAGKDIGGFTRYATVN